MSKKVYALMYYYEGTSYHQDLILNSSEDRYLYTFFNKTSAEKEANRLKGRMLSDIKIVDKYDWLVEQGVKMNISRGEYYNRQKKKVFIINLIRELNLGYAAYKLMEEMGGDFTNGLYNYIDVANQSPYFDRWEELYNLTYDWIHKNLDKEHRVYYSGHCSYPFEETYGYVHAPRALQTRDTPYGTWSNYLSGKEGVLTAKNYRLRIEVLKKSPYQALWWVEKNKENVE